MCERAAVLAERPFESEARRRGTLANTIPITALVLCDVILSIAVFVISYKLRQHTDMFIWRPRKSFWPVGVVNDFEPYLGFLFFVPIVKIYMLRRSGLRSEE